MGVGGAGSDAGAGVGVGVGEAGGVVHGVRWRTAQGIQVTEDLVVLPARAGRFPAQALGEDPGTTAARARWTESGNVKEMLSCQNNTLLTQLSIHLPFR